VFKPLLAPREAPSSYPEYFNKLRYPLMCSPKYDGIRCIVKNGIAMSRTGKPLPSYQVQDEFNTFEHFDGEIIEGNPTSPEVCNRTQSYVMSEKKFGEFTFYTFDYTHPDWLDKPFLDRYNKLKELSPLDPRCQYINHIMIYNYDDLLAYELESLKKGFEGIMLRDPEAPYKQGRGTFKEGIIYKLKRFEDAEGEIVDFEEQMTNTNVQEKDELGYAKRTIHKAGLVPANTLGKFVVYYNGDLINVAPGIFPHPMRKYIWEHKEEFRLKYLKFRFFNYGVKDSPRFARAIGMRDLTDIVT